MTTDDRQLPVPTRQSIIASIMAVNEKQLRLESAANGRDIQRACVLRDIEKLGASAALDEQLRNLDADMARLAAERQRLIMEREWLEQSLSSLLNQPPTASKQ